MSYFKRLPQIIYNNNDCVDLHKKLILAREIQSEWVESYDLVDGETLHDVSWKLYNSVEYWWMLSLINYYDDVHYDKFIKDDILQKLAKQLQVMELNDQRDYILFPPYCNIEYEIGDKIYTGRVIRKYIFNVSGQGSKFLLDVLLDDIDTPMLSSTNMKIKNSSIVKCTVDNNSIFLNGDLVRQNLNINSELEEFARGIVIYKNESDLYIDKTKSEDFVITGNSYSLDNGKIVTGDQLVLTKKYYVGSANITNTEILDEFLVNEFGLRDLYYLYRYDKLVEINNQKSKILVVKPNYLNVLKNNLIIIEEGE